jgi:glycosyltransferase involved in cell wall biosynthesis
MPKRILLVYTKNTGGTVNRKAALDSYIYCLAGLLTEKGKHTVYLNGTSYEEIRETNVNQASAAGNGSFLKKILPPSMKRILKDVLLLKAIDSLFKKLDTGTAYDLIIEFYSYASDVGYRLSKKRNIPLYIVYDAPVLDEYMLFNGTTPFFESKISSREKQTLLTAKTTVVYSNAVKQYIEKKINKPLAAAIHQNVDFSRFDLIDDKSFSGTITIGFIGSFLKWHNVDLLLEAFTKLMKEGYNLNLYLLGTGEEFEFIQQKVEQNSYKSRITMPGFVDGDVLLAFKKQIHIGVMPGSNWYGAPNKIFEYGASRMAVVAPDTPTIADLFADKQEVLLFELDSAKGLYDQLKQLVSNVELIRLLADNLQQKIKANHSKSNTFDFYNRLIKEA